MNETFRNHALCVILALTNPFVWVVALLALVLCAALVLAAIMCVALALAGFIVFFTASYLKDDLFPAAAPPKYPVAIPVEGTEPPVLAVPVRALAHASESGVAVTRHEVMTHEQLLAVAKERGIKAANRRWKRETLLARLAA